MKRAVVLAVAMLLLTAAPAHASNEQAFLDAVAPLGYTEPADALSAGYAVCVMRGQAGASLTERVLRRVLEKLRDARHADNVSPFSHAAAVHLCPRL
jgi:hypothetical protein